ncbi:hypothetical protein Droror1_Dr00009225 [Drosera rotundifolia]
METMCEQKPNKNFWAEDPSSRPIQQPMISAHKVQHVHPSIFLGFHITVLSVESNPKSSYSLILPRDQSSGFQSIDSITAMDLKHTTALHRHLENQAELLRDARKSMLHELERLQVEEEMLMRKFYEFMMTKENVVDGAALNYESGGASNVSAVVSKETVTQESLLRFP